MSYWVDDPQLFLYAKGPDDVILRRCNKPVSSSSSSLVVPMKSDDFEYERDVKNYVELIKDEFDWDETDYKRLVKYIYERLLLVNRQGLVIAEIYKLDDTNLVVPIYIRSLDVLRLKPYIPNIRERRIPLRTVKYLEDVNGEAARMEDDHSNLAKRVADLELKNKTLQGEVTKSNADLATRTCELANSQYQVADLELKNKTLQGEVTKSNADLASRTSELANSQYQVADLELKNKTLQGEVTKSNADLATRTYELANSQYQLNRVKKAYMEVWMNDDDMTDWMKGIETLRINSPDIHSLTVVGGQGSYTGEGSNTNVHARYWYKVSGQFRTQTIIFEAICIDDLNPNRERAKFSHAWQVCTIQGKKWVIR